MFNWVRNVLSGSAAADEAAAHKSRGNALLDEGNWEQAEACYRQAITAAPEDIDAWINLGFVLGEQKRYADARQALDKALALDAQAVDAWYMLGTMARSQGQIAEAIERFEKAIALKPEFELAHRDLFQVLAGAGQMARAREVLRRAVERHPQAADFHYYLGGLHAQAGEHDAAIRCFQQASALKPDFAEAHFNLGNLLVMLKRYEEAVASYDALLRLNPGHADALCNRGRALQGLGRAAEALPAYDDALRIDPASSIALFNRGSVLEDLGRHEEALAGYEQLLRREPDNADALRNRGNVLRSLNRMSEALDSYDRALRIGPRSADVLSNRGAVLADLNRYEEAMAGYAAALQLQPDHPGAHFNESLSRLLLGDFAQGWKKYEWRLEGGGSHAARRQFAQPQWSGNEPLHGKTILLHAEQGLGDTIQFVRYARLVKQKGATVLLEAQPALQSLLEKTEGVDRVLAAGQPLPAFDYHCPLLSLPLAFHTDADSIPAPAAYLPVDPARAAAWSTRLGPKTQARVGLVWSGSTIHKNDRNRSIRLAEFAGLLADGVQFTSLQKELRPEDAALLESKGVAHFGPLLVDFSDTAALASHMDLVISVDTSVAHLAAAIGKPVWLLLPSNPDWRWMLQRADSPWYPSMKLYRRPQSGGWAGVMSCIARDLAEWRLSRSK